MENFLNCIWKHLLNSRFSISTFHNCQKKASKPKRKKRFMALWCRKKPKPMERNSDTTKSENEKNKTNTSKWKSNEWESCKVISNSLEWCDFASFRRRLLLSFSNSNFAISYDFVKLYKFRWYNMERRADIMCVRAFYSAQTQLCALYNARTHTQPIFARFTRFFATTPSMCECIEFSSKKKLVSLH